MKIIGSLVLAVVLLPGITSAQFLFQDATSRAGIDMHYSGEQEVGPGVVVFDLDGDGWDDLYFGGGLDPSKMYRNNHDGTFTLLDLPNIANDSDYQGNAHRTFPRGGIAFDYDNDGHPDIYSVCENRDLLWHNNGDNTFRDATGAAGLASSLDQNQSNGASFGDFDGDGWNDFYVARWVEKSRFVPNGHGDTLYAHKGFPNYFYVNNHNGTFTERGKEYGIDGDTGTTNIALFFDYDRDGDLDLLIGNDFGVNLTPNQVFRNNLMETGKATFTDVTKEIGLGCRLFCMGIGPIDYDRDGKFDFFETSIGPDSMMHQNQDGTFSNVIKQVMPQPNGYEEHGKYLTTTWTALSGDFDNDGWEDLFVVHGFEGAIAPYSTDLNERDTSQFYHNIGGFFDNVTDNALLDASGLQAYLNVRGRGAASLDYNHDGKLDICFSSIASSNIIKSPDFRMLENITPASGHWMELHCTAKRTAKEAIGTIIDVWTGGIVHSRQISTGGGFGSQNSLTQHVGLGEYSIADSVIVYWPADMQRHRQIDRFYNVPADKIYTVKENMSSLPDPSLINPPIPASGVGTAAASVPAIYPNPAGATLTADNLGSKLKRFEIYDLLGIKRLDISSADNTLTLPVENLKPGCYILRISENGKTMTKEFIKR